MKKIKKLTALILSIGMIATVFTGCSNKDVERVKAKSAEEAIELFNKYSKEDNVEEMVKLYSDVYMGAVGYPTGTIVKMLKKNREGVEITKSETLKLEDIDENTKKAEVVSTAVKDKKEENYTYVYGIVKEDGGWAISPDGVIGYKDYETPELNKQDLNFFLSKTINTFEGTTFRVDVYNYTDKKYQFGVKDNFSKMKVETTDGEFETAMDDIAELDKKTQTYFTARVDGVTGEVKKITLTDMYECDKDGKPIADTKKDIVVYTK